MQLQKNLKNLRCPEQISALHLIRILFETYFPIGIKRAPARGEIRKDARELAVFRDPPQPDVRCIGKRHQYRHTAATKTEKVEFFECGTEGASADLLYGANALVGIN